jgi:uncharacterized membrane protein
MAERPDLSHPVFVHFYRAVVGHMDVWRQRMDATTNWAAATTAVMVTFSFSTVDAPHFVLLLAIGFNAVFLLMESRRYQIFDLWRRRFRLLNRHVVVPVLRGETEVVTEEQRLTLAGIGDDLGRLVPHLSLPRAMGYRIRRNYAYLFTVAGVAWILKLEVHPVAAESLLELIARAQIGGIPGEVVFLGVTLFAAGSLAMALRAPSEQMMNWTEVPSPLARWLARTPGASRSSQNRSGS